jgi:hypothetical protein
VHPPLPALPDQIHRLAELDLLPAHSTVTYLLAATADAPDDALFVPGPGHRSADVAPLLTHRGVAGFVVEDMTDVDEFSPIESALPPSDGWYLLTGLDRGDDLANWSPDEALPAILAAGRTPLTHVEGLHWVLQQPEVLERNRCFMTIGSRRRRPDGKLDARTPALWISNGTGRDGPARRHAPKLGWCWAGNRHTWLGFASARGRSVPAG